MPLSSTARIASPVICSLSISLSLSSAMRRLWLSLTLTRRGLVRPPIILPSMSPMLMAPMELPGIPGMSNIGMLAALSETWISMVLSLSSLPRRRLRKVSRVAGDAVGPTSASSTRSSAFFSAWARTSLRLASRTSANPTSTRSRMMLSTSRPT